MEPCKKKVKRDLSEAWLNEFKWMRKVPFNDSLFQCIVCNKNFLCSSLSYVKRHAETAYHKRKSEENTLSLDSNDNEKKSFNKTKFQPQWLDINEFKYWLREAENDESFSCAICKKTFQGGLSQIKRHADSKKHKKKCLEYDLSSNETNVEIDDESCLTFEEEKKLTEIRYAALIADCNIPSNIANTILTFFQNTNRKNPKLIGAMSMGRTKCTNVMSNVLCPVETNRIVKHLQNTKFSISVDETSDTTNEKWLTFHVRYVDTAILKVQAQLLKIININAADCSAKKLFDTFKNEMYKHEIPFHNIISLSCDNASVMTGKHLKHI